MWGVGSTYLFHIYAHPDPQLSLCHLQVFSFFVGCIGFFFSLSNISRIQTPSSIALYSILALSSFPERKPVESRPRILLQSHHSGSLLMTFQTTALLVLNKVSLRIQHWPKITILTGRKQIQLVLKLHMLYMDRNDVLYCCYCCCCE